MRKTILIFSCTILILTRAFTQTPSDTIGKPRPMAWKDVSSWKYIPPQNATLSPDGKWLAYPMLTFEGDGELIVKKLKDTVERKYPIGGSGATSFAFSEDGKWIAFRESASFKDTRAAARAPGKQLFEKLYLIELATGKKTVFEKTGPFSFNGRASSWLAVTIVKERPAGSPPPKPEDPRNNDLLLVELSSGKTLDIGNIGEYAFSKPGSFLAYTIDAAGRTGNGLYLFSPATRQTTVLDNDKMVYRSLAWHEDGNALAVVKMNKDEKYKTEKGILIGVKDLDRTPAVFTYDPAKDSVAFPKNMTVSNTRLPAWSDDDTRLFFGIHDLKAEKKTPDDKAGKKDSGSGAGPGSDLAKIDLLKKDTSIHTLEDLKKAVAKLDSTKTRPPSAKNEDEPKPDMTIWNWQDKRLQSEQQVREPQDKDFTYYCMFNVATSAFTRLNDSSMRTLTILPKQLYALGEDNSSYELDINLDGQQYDDFYIVDLRTGQRTKWMAKLYLPAGTSVPRPSPDGKKLLYGMDGHYYIYNIPEKTTVNLTEKVPASFVNTDDDHAVKKPLTPSLDFSSDSRYVLLANLWDIWQIPVSGLGPAVNLTLDGASTHTRHPRRFVLDRDEKGIDLSKPVYISLYGEWNKKSGIGRIDPGKNGLRPGISPLVWEDRTVQSLSRAKNADVYLFSRENSNAATEYFTTDALWHNQLQVSHNAPDAKKYTWSSGTQLVNYVSANGDTLQGALFLPANYEKGRKYPTIVYYYEKTSQTLHNYISPSYSRTGFLPTMYTSNGYAVFMPDIVYKIDDPGRSTIACVIPAVKAAIQTGIIDEKNIGIHGHSWGGYQTAFLITQTNMFKAAAAGAALTDLVSMYDLIYWNTGGGNMPIFEASQGRFTGAPWENWEAYQRNSPITYVKNIQTPLLMLHNDKDGAVDFTQGIEFYSALRRLKKPVVMIEYKGENHGLLKMENRKDYCIRMMEFFDYHLKGKPAPDWLSKGVDRLKMDDHLDSRP